MCTELVALRRLVERATVRTSHGARSIRSIVIALNAAGDEESDSEEDSDSELFISQNYLAAIKSSWFLTVLPSLDYRSSHLLQ